MRERSSVIVLIVLVAASSGCFGGKDKLDPSPTSPGTPTTVTGVVADDGELPLAGAQVRILLTNLSVVTDGNGSYRIEGAPAGPSALVASAPAHLAQERRVTLAAGVVNRVDFQLFTLNVPRPYNETLPFSGTIACSLPQAGGCSAEAGIDDANHHFPVKVGLAGLLVEMRWQASVGPSGERLSAQVRAANTTACGLPIPDATATSASPLRLEVTSGFAISGGHQCLVVSVPSDAAAVNQDYEAWVTLFYHSGIPAGFTAMPPA